MLFPDLCTNSAVNITSDIVEYLDCGDVSDKITFGNVSKLALANGTFCSLSNDRATNDEEVDMGHILRCDISEGHPAFETCFSSSGTHLRTFWSYLAARCVYLWAKDSVFVLFDGTSLRYGLQNFMLSHENWI